jgi:hypothetical protein
MGLFGKGKDGATSGEKDLAKAIAKRGVPGEATITAMTPTGQTRGGGEGKEIEFSLRLEVAGTVYEPVVRQFLNDLSLTGLAPGEPVSVLYDRDDPATLIVMQSPKYVFVHNPNAAFGGPTMIAVPTGRAESDGTQGS